MKTIKRMLSVVVVFGAVSLIGALTMPYSIFILLGLCMLGCLYNLVKVFDDF